MAVAQGGQLAACQKRDDGARRDLECPKGDSQPGGAPREGVHRAAGQAVLDDLFFDQHEAAGFGDAEQLLDGAALVGTGCAEGGPDQVMKHVSEDDDVERLGREAGIEDGGEEEANAAIGLSHAIGGYQFGVAGRDGAVDAAEEFGEEDAAAAAEFADGKRSIVPAGRCRPLFEKGDHG